jgi:hypothetical protein
MHTVPINTFNDLVTLIAESCVDNGFVDSLKIPDVENLEFRTLQEISETAARQYTTPRTVKH